MSRFEKPESILDNKIQDTLITTPGTLKHSIIVKVHLRPQYIDETWGLTRAMAIVDTDYKKSELEEGKIKTYLEKAKSIVIPFDKQETFEIIKEKS
ncbi:MAG: hypothetical protein WCK98_03055 [bacterium]